MNDTPKYKQTFNNSKDMSATGASTTNFYEQKIVYYNQKQLDQALAQNRKAILEEVRKKVIGDDEKRFFRENINALKHETRNELRAEQRQKLSLLEGETK